MFNHNSFFISKEDIIKKNDNTFIYVPLYPLLPIELINENTICDFCLDKGHTFYMCGKYLNELKNPCQLCNNIGHIVFNCCYRCIKCTDIHYFFQCPKECYLCKKQNHMIDDCDQKCISNQCIYPIPHLAFNCNKRFIINGFKIFDPQFKKQCCYCNKNKFLCIVDDTYYKDTMALCKVCIKIII